MSTDTGSTDSARYQAEDILARLEARDPSLWAQGNVSANRLGWLDSPGEMARGARDLNSWAQSLDQETVILLGMGGSSLGPLVLSAALDAPGCSSNGRRLVVCDTTHPSTLASLDLSDAFILVSSKSGTTLEPNVLASYVGSTIKDPSRFAAITDPGTPLADLARERGFHRLFANRPDIGGRYSVLSHFGLVPAALLGYDVEELCSLAMEADRLEAVNLGLEMGLAARGGQDKITILVPESFRHFGLWLEQLIAESTGKQGTGCVPVPTTVVEEGPDRHSVVVRLSKPTDLAAQFLSWEIATAAAGHVLGIDPFDEPNVAESKANTARELEAPIPAEIPTADISEVSEWLAARVQQGDYISIQAYLPFGCDDALEALRRGLTRSLSVAVTAGYGPRFLHSTGQLHKGGPNEVVAVQLVNRSEVPRLAIPGKQYDFATLIAAQSAGDHQSLVAHGRRVLRVALDDPAELTAALANVADTGTNTGADKTNTTGGNR
ncbi:MAG: glucose-6-phosphate isomerase [Acidimicrobiales bacterium]